ncbi:uncharacterized protein LOC108330414 [Vigna angularis]|uniref:uncharacterized protein LOC108330414 n=1 Tax=Phaseolus angularis TaxID=3914 RepID=UPI000809B62A|nr:uncharacterized protein LOC108330414 [Vigna angularis]
MEAYLDANDVWEAVEENYGVSPLPNNPTEEYEGNERIKRMQALNLVRELEMQKMKDSETIKNYADKLLGIANKIRLLGTEISNSRIVQKILVTILERYEATLTSLKNSKDLSIITLTKLLTALQAPEQRRLMREKGHIEGAS